MSYVVLCGPRNTAPDRIVGPFDTVEEADAWAATQPGEADGRYAVSQELSAPA